MAYQSKTWSLSDEVVAEIDRRVQVMTEKTGSGSPNRVLRAVLGIDNGELAAHLRAMTPDNNRETLARMFPQSETIAHLDAPTPELSSGKGKATVETRGIRDKGDNKR